MEPEDATSAKFRGRAESREIPNVIAETCARVAYGDSKSLPARCGEFYTPEEEDSGVSEISPRVVADASSKAPTDIASVAPVAGHGQNQHAAPEAPTELMRRDAGDPP